MIVAVALLCLSLQTLAQTVPKSSPAQRNIAVRVSEKEKPAEHPHRIALVIGNSAYKDAPLINPVNDARAIARALTETGFQVVLKENSPQRVMLDALRDFGDRLRQGGTGLFYFAGHGMQVKGRNYLIPVGANIEREDEVAYAAVDAQAVLDKMESAGNNANIMILDACRNNPFARSTRSGQSGLAQMDAPIGTLVAYATAPGSVASDGSGGNGLYTQHLLKAMRQPGYKLEDVFKQVRAGVRKDSQGKQVPWESTSLEGDFYFSMPPSPPPSAARDPHLELEDAVWDTVKSSFQAIELQAYLNRYPQGRYIKEALARLQQLEPPHPNTATTPEEKLPGIPANPAVVDASNDDSVFHVGDNWQYQVIDPDAHTVLSKGKWTVTRIQLDQTLLINNGTNKWAADGSEYFRDLNDGHRLVNENGFRRYPLHWRVGYAESLRYKRYGEDNRRNYDDGVTTDIRVVGPELIHVPAGTFDAWKVSMTSNVQRRIMGKSNTTNITELETCWYAPALKIYAACVREVRLPDEASYRERTEIVEFSFPSHQQRATQSVEQKAD